MIQNISNSANTLRVPNSNVQFSPVSTTGYSSKSVMYAAPQNPPVNKPWYSIFTNFFSKVGSFFVGVYKAVKNYICGPDPLPPLSEKDKAAKFLDLVKNGAAGTAEEKQAFSALFATLKPESQNVIKRQIWVAGGALQNLGYDFSEDKLKNDPKSAYVSTAVEKFINNFDKYNGLNEFEAVVNDGTKTGAEVTAALVKLAPFNNLHEAIKYRVWEIVGQGSNVPDFSGTFIQNNPHNKEIKDAIGDVRNAI